MQKSNFKDRNYNLTLKERRDFKIALVHDYLAGFGGAERVLGVLHEMFPQAPIYTSIFLPEQFGPHSDRVRQWPVSTSIAQKLPGKRFLISSLRIISPWLFKQFDLSEYDVVMVSATGAYFPNAIKVRQGAKQICYCHTPPRYLYGLPTARNWRRYWWGRIAGEVTNHFLRMVDFEVSKNVTLYLANSKEVASRIKKYYRREAKVVYPPIEIEKYKPKAKSQKLKIKGKSGEYFLTGGRLARAKRVDLAIRVCTRLGLALKVFGKAFAGYGKELKRMAGSTVEFLGEVDEEELIVLMQECKAFIFCADKEDFGMTPVEVMAAGRPVVAYRSGGVMESVAEGVTGEFFDELSEESLEKKLKNFKEGKYKREDCIKQADKFNRERFEKEVRVVLAKIGS